MKYLTDKEITMENDIGALKHELSVLQADYKNEQDIAAKEQAMIVVDRQHISDLEHTVNKEKDVEK
jgi:hypothetical protein